MCQLPADVSSRGFNGRPRLVRLPGARAGRVPRLMRQRVAVLADGVARGRRGRRRRGPHPGAGAAHRPTAARHGGDRSRLAAPGRLRDGSGSRRRARPGVPGPRAHPRRVLPAPRLADRPRAAAGGRPGAACSRWRPLVAARSTPSSPDLGVVSAGHCLRQLRARVRLRRRPVADWRTSPPIRSARRIGHDGGLVLPHRLQSRGPRQRGCILVRFCRATAPGAEEQNGPATRRGRFPGFLCQGAIAMSKMCTLAFGGRTTNSIVLDGSSGTELAKTLYFTVALP
ncbi:hypothetical protein ABID95_004770 [Streptomyces atratus]